MISGVLDGSHHCYRWLYNNLYNHDKKMSRDVLSFPLRSTARPPSTPYWGTRRGWAQKTWTSHSRRLGPPSTMPHSPDSSKSPSPRVGRYFIPQMYGQLGNRILFRSRHRSIHHSISRYCYPIGSQGSQNVTFALSLALILINLLSFEFIIYSLKYEFLCRFADTMV